MAKRKDLLDVPMRNWKDAEGNKLNDIGYKYSKNFWNYYNEKQFCIEHMDLTDVNTVLDIGAGVGLLGVILENIEHLDITVEATDIEETFVGGMYQEIFAHMKTPRHMCEIKNKIPIVLPKHYDMITMKDDWLLLKRKSAILKNLIMNFFLMTYFSIQTDFFGKQIIKI